jgi:hypothetical protein
MGSRIGFEEETHKEKHADAINNEGAKLHAKHTKVQHHNPQVEELVEDAGALEEEDPS